MPTPTGYTSEYTRTEIDAAIGAVKDKTIYPIATQQVDGLLAKTDKVVIDNSVTDDEELTIQEINELLNF